MFRDKVRGSDIWREIGVEPLLLHNKRMLAEVVRAYDQDAFWLPPVAGFPGMCTYREIPG